MVASLPRPDGKGQRVKGEPGQINAIEVALLCPVPKIAGSKPARFKPLAQLPSRSLAVHQKRQHRIHRNTFRKPARVIEYDLNRADTADFESVAGIGKKTAGRIIRYRAALGGFLRREQLYEVYGIDSLAIFSMDRFFVGQSFKPTVIDVNGSTYEELEAHPYLSALQARAILMYRFQHGRIDGEEQLMKVRLMDTKTAERIRPYLDYR